MSGVPINYLNCRLMEEREVDTIKKEDTTKVKEMLQQ
jgi:hypothetical protein